MHELSNVNGGRSSFPWKQSIDLRCPYLLQVVQPQIRDGCEDEAEALSCLIITSEYFYLCVYNYVFFFCIQGSFRSSAKDVIVLIRFSQRYNVFTAVQKHNNSNYLTV